MDGKKKKETVNVSHDFRPPTREFRAKCVPFVSTNRINRFGLGFNSVSVEYRQKPVHDLSHTSRVLCRVGRETRIYWLSETAPS